MLWRRWTLSPADIQPNIWNKNEKKNKTKTEMKKTKQKLKIANQTTNLIKSIPSNGAENLVGCRDPPILKFIFN